MCQNTNLKKVFLKFRINKNNRLKITTDTDYTSLPTHSKHHTNIDVTVKIKKILKNFNKNRKVTNSKTLKFSLF